MSITLWVILSVLFTGVAWYFIFKEEKRQQPTRRNKGAAIFTMSIAAFVSVFVAALMSLHYMIPVVVLTAVVGVLGIWRLMSWLYDRYVV